MPSCAPEGHPSFTAKKEDNSSKVLLMMDQDVTTLTGMSCCVYPTITNWQITVQNMNR